MERPWPTNVAILAQDVLLLCSVVYARDMILLAYFVAVAVLSDNSCDDGDATLARASTVRKHDSMDASMCRECDWNHTDKAELKSFP